MLRVAVLLDNTLKTDRRALMELSTLNKLPIDLTLFCNKEPDLPENEQRGNMKIKRLFNSAMWAFSSRKLLDDFAKKLSEENFDVLHCHDQYLLHVGATVKRLKPNTILIYESRELFHSWPLNYANLSFINTIKAKIVRLYEMRREKQNGKQIDYLITVNESLGNILEKYFNIKNKAIITRNIPAFKEIPEKDFTLRHKYHIPDKDNVVVYIGVNVYRHTNCMEQFVDAIAGMNNLHLIIITRRNERRIWFENYVREKGYHNIYFHDLIPVDKIEETISCCNIGLVTAWYKKKLSYWLALDNKLFTYIMSEMPILGTAQPEYEKIIINHHVGQCVNPETPGSIEKAINELILNKSTYIINCKKAKYDLCWEKEEASLLSLYHQLIKGKM